MFNLSHDQVNFVNEFLEEVHLARMATVGQDLQPHVVPVWYGWDGESLWISSYANTRKGQELERNPKISIAVDTTDETGGTQAVILEGTARLVREPRAFLEDKFYWIYRRYLGEDGVLKPDPQKWIKDAHNLLIQLTPERVYTWNW